MAKRYKTSLSSVRVTGMKELVQSINKITDVKVQNRMLRKAAKAAFARVLSEAQSTAPSDSTTETNIASGIKLKTKMLNTREAEEYNKLSKQYQKIKTGSVRGASKFKGKAAGVVVAVETGSESREYIMAVEFGAEAFLIERTYSSGKKQFLEEFIIEPQPFMRTALNNNRDWVLRKFSSVMRQELAKEFRKAAKRQARVMKQTR